MPDIEDEMKDVQQLVVNQLGIANGLNNSIADGQVTPAKLSAGGPSFDTAGDVTVKKNLIVNGNGNSSSIELNKAVTGTGSSHVDFHSDSGSNDDFDARIISHKNGEFELVNKRLGKPVNFKTTRDDSGTIKTNTHLSIRESGNIGIGTESPAEKLHIVGQTRIVNSETVFANNPEKGTLQIYHPNGVGKLAFDHNEILCSESLAVRVAKDQDFNVQATTDNASTATNVFTVKTATKRVGVGTTSPDGNLHVGTGTTADGTDVDIVLGGDDRTQRQAIIRKKIQSGDRALEIIASANTAPEDIRFFAGTGGANEKMRIHADGRVGIGTSTISGTGTKLQVSGGNVLSDGFRAAQGIPNSANNSTTGYAFGTDGDTGLFCTGTGGSAGGDLAFFSNNSKKFVVKAHTGNVNIGVDRAPANHPTNEANVHVIAGTLGTTSGNSQNPLTLQSSTGNVDRLKFTVERTANQGGWEYACHKITRRVDSTDMGFIKFGNHSLYPLSFGRASHAAFEINNVGVPYVRGNSTNGNAVMRLVSDNTDTNTNAVQFGTPADNYRGQVQYELTANKMNFVTGGARAGHINSSGQLEMRGGIFIDGGTEDGKSLHLMSKNHTQMQLDNFKGNFRVVSAPEAGGTGTEMLRLHPDGHLLIGNPDSITKGFDGNSVKLKTSDGVHISRDGTAERLQMTFSNNNGVVGEITTNGDVCSFASTSDYRLKEDIVDIEDSISKLKNIKPVNFAWKSDGSRSDGFIAHELAEVVPSAVNGEKDAMEIQEYQVSPAEYEEIVIPATESIEAEYDEEGNEIVSPIEGQPERIESKLVKDAVLDTREVIAPQSADYSKLVPLLTKALQDSIAKIEALETRLDALENA